MLNENNELKNKKGTFQTVITVISFIIFLILYKIFILNEVEPFYFQGLLLIIPTALFAFLTFCVKKNILNKWIVNILIIIISVCSVPLTFIFMVYLSFGSANPVTDINKYERVLKLNNYKTNVSIMHFPKTLPKEAENIQFFHTPQLLQGAEQCFLKFNINSTYIDEEINNSLKNCQWHGDILTDINSGYEYSSYGLSYNTFYLMGYDGYGFQNSNTSNTKYVENLYVYVLDSKPYEENNWNHGYTYGIAVDKIDSTIIYFERKW